MNSNKKIKVLIRHRSMEMGGVEKVVLDLLNNLPRDIFDITFLLSLYQGELRKEIPTDIRLITLQKGKEDMSSNKILKTLQLIRRNLILLYYRKNPKYLYKKIIKEEFDIEIAPTYSEFDNVLNSPLKSRKIGWFHTDVSYDPDQKRVLHRINNLKKFDWIIFGSQQTRQVINDLYNIQYPNSCVIYNVIKINEVKNKSKEISITFDKQPVFSSMGRLHSRKGYHTLMNIHKRLLNEGLQHSIVVIGGGHEMENLKNQAKELNVEETFTLIGSQNNPYPYILASDFFVLPSESESYPLTLGEVMALEIPIISTNVGGIPEMIDHSYDGYLTSPDEDSIYKAMKLFLTQPEEVRKIKENTKKGIEKFDNQAIYDQITEVLTTQYHLKNG